MYFKSHISVTNRFVLSVTYFKSCSRVLPALIFFMARHRPKKSAWHILHIHNQENMGSARFPSQFRLCPYRTEWEGGIGAIPEAFQPRRMENWGQVVKLGSPANREWDKEQLVPKPPCGAPMTVMLPLHGPPIIQMSLDIGRSMSA